MSNLCHGCSSLAAILCISNPLCIKEKDDHLEEKGEFNWNPNHEPRGMVQEVRKRPMLQVATGMIRGYVKRVRTVVTNGVVGGMEVLYLRTRKSDMCTSTKYQEGRTAMNIDK
jgi:hypothetical protein